MPNGKNMRKTMEWHQWILWIAAVWGALLSTALAVRTFISERTKLRVEASLIFDGRSSRPKDLSGHTLNIRVINQSRHSVLIKDWHLNVNSSEIIGIVNTMDMPKRIETNDFASFSMPIENNPCLKNEIISFGVIDGKGKIWLIGKRNLETLNKHLKIAFSEIEGNYPLSENPTKVILYDQKK